MYSTPMLFASRVLFLFIIHSQPGTCNLNRSLMLERNLPFLIRTLYCLLSIDDLTLLYTLAIYLLSGA